ncbi:NDP-sugar epimerase, includes UDP-GlcNAc-inverting 4,6-dehydratase FlaA1 and capsular polysaccharide biosynthesis protein EpsC [Anaerosporobacter mobilis DSM 15930]|uniref:NDP-sugar epimerase, includes UDP-GlcNAc-inverting 4,6-dehydratase FlaA1 and capsular polysaccharide biosynthesis protein EpsC n=1 Tax=Anaerosporobacter mobilis DSM 15930 TaxID=1120996 RepID=A0A1M7LDC8_9FIRM|nr:nucleoside-diphosphate sugar epimerase/dehydratase [Anaerosporobacter mobilis]SHM76168.1 NDP-sugar epimerase, includes UDP-GlcNAc-inverting 4,6-dehydratase FlaA1 and capsular polysaccharide biosynthesis protein EpsC [Anaerosporobacter mobilis DSM 15930]
MLRLIKENKLLLRRIFLIILDSLMINVCAFMAILIRFDLSFNNIPTHYLDAILAYVPWNTVITILIFYCCRLYHSLWKYASIDEVTNVMIGCILAAAAQYIGIHVMNLHVPRSYYPLSMVFLMVGVVGTRFIYRFLRLLSNRYHGAKKSRIMIIGAGEAANVIIREITVSQYVDGSVVCIIDDNRSKVGRYIQGVKIVGTRHKIVEAARKYEITDIIIAIPTAPRKEIRSILEICKETNCTLKILPGIYQLINEEVSVSRLRTVEIEDLLGREPVRIDAREVSDFLRGKIVMVTGGGGSIGSELCRQIASFSPAKLIIVDIYENNAYFVQQELKNRYPKIELEVLIASVRNTNRMDQIFDKYRPEFVYHAAAHKHVPLMEDSPNEAIKNNVGGTLKLAKAADKYGVKRFIFISTDKAVNPTNIMGASKRICEMIIQSFNRRSQTEFVAVRFGNVLGSNGSVIPLFKQQIMNGGPVTVTHPDIIRYFMTIPEAVSLVLQAGVYAHGGEIFVLDMGEPVKIADLAKNLIKLSGFIPDKDIRIEYTGLRPGEKLYEELLMKEEGLKETNNNRIFVGEPIIFDDDEFVEAVENLDCLAKQECKEIREEVKKLVPTYEYKE